MRKIIGLFASTAFLLLGGCTNAEYDDVGAATYAVCCGANCCCPGIGDGSPISTGDMNPDNPCEVCDPSTDPNSWTPVAGCGEDAGGGGGTDAGGGMTGTDAGPGTTGGDDGGCSVSAGPASGFGLALFSVVAVLFTFRRRRA